MERLGDGPVEDRYRQQMELVVTLLDEVFNGKAGGPGREVGFVLLIFPFGYTKGRCNIMSNGANREDLVALFKEMIARFEGQPEMSGTA